MNYHQRRRNNWNNNYRPYYGPPKQIWTGEEYLTMERINELVKKKKIEQEEKRIEAMIGRIAKELNKGKEEVEKPKVTSHKPESINKSMLAMMKEMVEVMKSLKEETRSHKKGKERNSDEEAEPVKLRKKGKKNQRSKFVEEKTESEEEELEKETRAIQMKGDTPILDSMDICNEELQEDAKKQERIERIVDEFQKLQDANKKSFVSKLSAKCRKYRVEYDKTNLKETILRVAKEMATQNCLSL